ncbi:MAG: cytidylate kinase family protein [Candidatus Rokubacteria bacterium]|nr:cytidylate kinase family protein [Candidatus Rokubacteria bacterium]
MAIITISHEMGAGGPEIGMTVAQRLGYRYADHELILDTAQRYGLLEEKLSHLDESKPSFFERLDTETHQYITAIQTTLLEFADQDNVVLMGRSGQWLLRGIPHVLRVRVKAPFELRVKRALKKMAGQMGEAVNPRTVTDMVRRDDAEKAGRFRYLYELDINDPSLYELVLNTEKVSTETAVELIATAARRPDFATTEAGRQVVADRALASRVQVALATQPETRKYRITVEAQQGVVTLEATAALDQAVEVARTVHGVRDVKTRQVEIPPIPPFVA